MTGWAAGGSDALCLHWEASQYRGAPVSRPSWKRCTSFVGDLQRRSWSDFSAPDSRQLPHRCLIHATDSWPCKLAGPKPLTRAVYALGLGMWSSAVDHSFDFAYQRDAIANSVSTTPSFSAPPRLLLPYADQLLRLVLILSLSCLYLAVHTKPKPSLPCPIDGSFTSLLGLRMDQKKNLFAPVW